MEGVEGAWESTVDGMMWLGWLRWCAVAYARRLRRIPIGPLHV